MTGLKEGMALAEGTGSHNAASLVRIYLRDGDGSARFLICVC
jgi:hypothetical protein